MPATPQATAGIPDHLMQYVDEDMQIHVQTYVDRVREIARGLVDPVILIEQRYSYSDYVPDGSGTADVVIIRTLKPDEVPRRLGHRSEVWTGPARGRPGQRAAAALRAGCGSGAVVPVPGQWHGG